MAQYVQEELPIATYLRRFGGKPEAQRWPLVQGSIANEPLTILRRVAARPALAMPEANLAAPFDDCKQTCNRFDLFSVAL